MKSSMHLQNHMNKFSLVLLVLLINVIYSCQKEPGEKLNQYPKTYKSILISDSEIKIYTKDGEEILSDVKDDVIQRYKNYLSDLETIEIDGKVIAEYLTESTVKVTVDDEVDEQVRHVYEYEGITYWEKQDTSAMQISLMSMDILIHKPLYYEEYRVPAVTGYNTAARYKECFYVKNTAEGFEVPMFDFLYISEIGPFVNNGINNEFDEHGLRLSGSNDTIIIQSFTIDMKKNMML